MLGGDRLGVELDSPLGAGAVFDRHWDAVAAGDLVQGGRQRLGETERVVADRLKGAGDAGEEW